MLKSKKLLSILAAVSMVSALGSALPVNAADSKLVLADFTDTEAVNLPMDNTNGRVEEGTTEIVPQDRIIKDTTISYGTAVQSGRWTVNGSNSGLAYIPVSESTAAAASNYDTFVIRFYSKEASDKFTVLFGTSSSGTFNSANPYYYYDLTVSKAGWQEEAISVSDIKARLVKKDSSFDAIRSFKIHKGGWDATDGNFNKDNVLYFDSMWFENRKLMFLDFTTPASTDDMPMTDPDSNQRGKIYKDTTIHYGNAAQSGKWSVPSEVGLLKAYNIPDSFDLGAAASCDNFVIRFYSQEASDEFNVLLGTSETFNSSNPYYRYTLTVSKAGWQEEVIPVSDIKESLADKGISFADIKTFKLDKGNWGSTPNYENLLYFDTMWFAMEDTFNASFSYVSSEYDDASNVGIYDTITLEFDEALNSTVACDAVAVYRGETEVTDFSVWTEGNKLCIKTNEAMHFDSSYRIKITPSLQSVRGYTLDAEKEISFSTAAPCFAADALRLTDAEGNELVDIPAEGETVKACVSAINGSDKDQDIVMIIAMYNSDGVLIAISPLDIITTAANTVVPAELANSCVVVNGTAAIRGYIWDGTDMITPYGVCAEINN